MRGDGSATNARDGEQDPGYRARDRGVELLAFFLSLYSCTRQSIGIANFA